MAQRVPRQISEKGPIDIGKLDNLGRIRLNREALATMNWKVGQAVSLEFLPDGTGLALRLSQNVCIHCGETNKASLIQVKPESMICLNCLDVARKKCREA